MTADDSAHPDSILVIRAVGTIGVGDITVFRLDPDGGEELVERFPYGGERAAYKTMTEVLQRGIDVGIVGAVVDFTDVKWLGSTGLAFLVGGFRNFWDAGGRSAIANVEPRVANTFRITMLDQRFPVFATVAEARDHLLRPPDEDAETE